MHELPAEIVDALSKRMLPSNKTIMQAFDYCQNKGNEQFIFRFFTRCLKECKSESIITMFINHLKKSVAEDKDFATYIINQHVDHISMMLCNSNAIVRNEYAQFLCYSMQFSSQESNAELISYLLDQLPSAYDNWLNFDEFFLPFLHILPCVNDQLILSKIFEFLNCEQKDTINYRNINMNNVFKLLVVLMASPDLKSQYKSVVFSKSFLDKWFQSPHHSVSFSQLLRSFVVDCPELATNYFDFIVKNAESLEPITAAGHFSVLLASQSKPNEEQIKWYFDFLRPKTADYVNKFIATLTTKIIENKVDFASSLLKFPNIWINDWLLGNDNELRETVEKHVQAVFTDSNSLTHLFNCLISVFSYVTETTLKGKKNLSSIEDQIPSTNYYKLLSWTIQKCNMNSYIIKFSDQLYSALYSYRKLNLMNNVPRNDLFHVISLCYNDSNSFFEKIPPPRFLECFDDLSFSQEYMEKNSNLALEIFNFLRINNMIHIAQSQLFKNVVEKCLIEDCDINDTFANFISSAISSESAVAVANSIWESQQFISKSTHFYPITFQLITIYPKTSLVFMNMKIQLYLIDDIKYIRLLKEFTESYQTYYKETKTWLGISLINSLVSFWESNRNKICEYIDKLGTDQRTLTPAFHDICELLRVVISLSRKLQSIVFEKIVQNKNKLFNNKQENIKSLWLLISSLLKLIKEDSNRSFPKKLELLTSDFRNEIQDQFIIDDFARLSK